MFAFPEPFAAATRNQFESQLAILNSFTSTMFDSMQKIADLNLNVAKSSLQESHAAAQQAINVKDAQAFFSMYAIQAQPNTEKLLAYSHQLASIVSSAQVEFRKTAKQAADTLEVHLNTAADSTPHATEKTTRRTRKST